MKKDLWPTCFWLAESEYPAYDGKKPGLTIAAWVQYVLDNFATVAEAVENLSKEQFTVVSDKVPGMDRMDNLHVYLRCNRRQCYF